jgi:hypothetical protein
MRTSSVISLLALAACGSGDGDDIDDGCWPDIPTTPHGSAVLGTGYTSYEPMPEMLPLEYGVQDGYNFVAHAKMTGFHPGNPADILDKKNPRTRIRAFFADTDVPLNIYASCAVRLSYVDAGNGEYELQSGIPIIFETCWRSDKLIGQRFRIELELMDSEGRIATDSKIVIATPPAIEYPMEMNTPGCVH